MQKGNVKRRLAGGASALALALTGVVAASGAALADVGPNDPSHPGQGKLTIVKHEGATAAAGDGTQQQIDQPLLGGVKFTLWQIGVIDESGNCAALELTDPEAWDKIPTSGYPTELPAGTDEGTLCAMDPNGGEEKTTNSDGEITFEDLELGLYYVEETDATEAYKIVDGAQVNVSVTGKAAPFFVTIPLPNDRDWIYDVYAYPKNQVTDGPSKTINADPDQQGYKVGDTVAYEISQTVPALKPGQDKYTSATIWETFSSGMRFGALTSITINDVSVTDYTQSPATDPADKVSWALGETALATLKEGDVIKIAFTGVVTEVTNSGSIENPMSESPEDPGYGSEFNGDKTPKPPVTPPNPITYWGQLDVTKIDEDGGKLAGAEFAVGLPGEDGTCAADAPDTPISTGVAGSNGVVKWGAEQVSPLGLWITNTNDEAAANPAGKSKDYCLYETKAPAGYEGIANPILVNIEPGATKVLELDVENVQKDGPDLPLTGASGTMLMTIGGAGLLAVAAGVYLAMRRRQAAEA